MASIVRKMSSLMIVGSIAFRVPNTPNNLLLSGSSGRRRVDVMPIPYYIKLGLGGSVTDNSLVLLTTPHCHLTK